MQFGNQSTWRGGSALNFPKGKTAKALPEIAALITFPVRESKINQP